MKVLFTIRAVNTRREYVKFECRAFCLGSFRLYLKGKLKHLFVDAGKPAERKPDDIDPGKAVAVGIVSDNVKD